MTSNKTLSYSDYERIRSLRPELWSEDDLAHFLILDGFVLPNEATWVKDAQVVQKTYFEQQQLLTQKYNRWRLVFKFSDEFFLNLYIRRKKQNKKNILFQDSRYSSIILEAKKYHHVGLITEGKKDRLFALKHFLGYMGTNDLNRYVFYYLKEKNIKYLYQLVAKTEEKLKIFMPDYIILRDDCSPITRAIVLASKKLGITTAVIQHGLYDSCTTLYNCKAADYVFVWGNYFKDFFVRENIRDQKEVCVLGYPHAIEKEELAGKEIQPYTVCYLGQDFERYNVDLLKIKLENLTNLSNICKKLGFKFIYRPHPTDFRESLQEKLKDIQFTAPKETLKETIKRASVFIGFSSTSLAEAAMASKFCLQLRNYPMETDNFEKLGVCSKSFKNIVELENYLKIVSESPNLEKLRVKFNNNYIEPRYDPARRFLEIIEEIEKQK